MGRRVFHLVHTAADGCWLLHESGRVIDSFPSKEQAVLHGRGLGQAVQFNGGSAHLVIHREDGSFDTDFTYGAAT